MKSNVKNTINKAFISRLLLSIVIIFTIQLAAANYLSPSFAANSPDYIQGVWVSSIINLDFPAEQGMSVDELKEQTDSIITDCKSLGINTIFLQVRPSSDALYKSEIFPWSRYITGVQGVAPSDSYDPLDYWVQKAHQNEIELHAWINPYRITREAGDYETLSSSNPAILHPDRTILYNGNYYYDPAVPEVREMVVKGALEIVNTYDVDGIHLDDYFYPGTDFNDSASFMKYNTENYTDLGDWRRNNVDLLIKALDERLHSADPGISFGVSPFGIWANKSSNSLGSETRGSESYYKLYCDSRKWALEGWIDYIAPQIYWNIGYEIADYDVLLNWWADTLKSSPTKLYIGLADYKSGNADTTSPWYGTSEITRQMDLNRKNSIVDGEIHFRYKSLAEIPGLRDSLKSFYINGSDTNAPPLVFSDLANAEWAKDHIYKLVAAGVVNGYGDGTFHPSKNVTRSEYIKMLVEAFEFRTFIPSDFISSIKDNPSAEWYHPYVLSAEYNKILPGSLIDFYPNEQITREDMAVYAYNAILNTGTVLPHYIISDHFTDDEDLAGEARKAVYSLSSAGIINGYEDMTFRPEGKATRAESSKVISKLLDLYKFD